MHAKCLFNCLYSTYRSTITFIILLTALHHFLRININYQPCNAMPNRPIKIWDQLTITLSGNLGFKAFIVTDMYFDS
jgi:hypothetical protein